MKRFNPFARVKATHGAPMGRHGHSADSWDGEGKLYARHCGGDGYYDRGGAYWGHSKVCAVWTRGGDWCAYVEARSPHEAIRIVADHAGFDTVSSMSRQHYIDTGRYLHNEEVTKINASEGD